MRGFNQWQSGFFGRVCVVTFIVLWILFFAGPLIFFSLGAFLFPNAQKDINIVFGLLFGMFALQMTIKAVTLFIKTNKSKEKKSMKMVQIIVSGVWVSGVVFMVLPDTLGKIKLDYFLNSDGLKFFGLAFLLGIITAFLTKPKAIKSDLDSDSGARKKRNYFFLFGTQKMTALKSKNFLKESDRES